MATELVLERPPPLLRRGTSIEEKDLDPWTAWAYRPRTLTFLLLGACLLVWASGALDPDASSRHDSATNVCRGIWAVIAVFLGYCLLQAPPTILIRPHPSVWRFVHGIAVVYLVFLSFILFQARDDARQFMKYLHKDLGVELPEKSYGSDCRLYTPENTESSKYTWVSFLKLKSEAFGSIRDWKAMVEKEKDLKVKSIRSDRGGEFLSENFARWCKSEGIRCQLTTPYTPSQNGVVERKNRTIMEMARAMLAHASLPRSYRAEACNTTVYVQNRSPTHALQDMTPFQAYYGRKPTVSHFRVFGCSAFVHIPKEKRQKLDFKSRKLLFLGYSAESDAYRLYDPDTRTTTVSRDVVFDESFITSAEGAAVQPIPILPPPSLPDPPSSSVITPSTSHPVPPI
ncbi:hypothetical protein L7F22_050964 [Adiantum nelumboides]|nr:hypothetical protein [Adiantum nelumboides]